MKFQQTFLCQCMRETSFFLWQYNNDIIRLTNFIKINSNIILVGGFKFNSLSQNKHVR